MAEKNNSWAHVEENLLAFEATQDSLFFLLEQTTDSYGCSSGSIFGFASLSTRERLPHGQREVKLEGSVQGRDGLTKDL